ncbi:MAG: hypothetical protein OXU83_01020 [Gammaproteobacteria bacterium]|nr:hypothetical protein [Gammaproteobacteria bacterium]
MKKYALAIALPLLALLALALWAGWARLAPPAFSGDGLWQGRFDINQRGDFQLTVLHSNGRLIALSPDARVAYRGSAAFEDGNYRAEMDMFFINGSPFDKATLTGAVVSPQRIEARFRTHGAGDEGGLVLEYDAATYEKNSSLDRLEGQWILYQGFTITKFTINGDGTFHGADTNGCGYEGLIEIINPDYNAYRARLFASSCDNLDGEYEGMAFLMSSLAENDTLHMQISNDDWGLYMPIVRDG